MDGGQGHKREYCDFSLKGNIMFGISGVRNATKGGSARPFEEPNVVMGVGGLIN